MKRLIESSAWDEAIHPPLDSSFGMPDDGCSSSATKYRQSSSPPLSAPASSGALDHRRYHPTGSATGTWQDRMPRVEAPLSVGSLKREYDLDTLRMHERRVKHALAQGRPLRPPPRLPTHPPSSKANLTFPSLVESKRDFGRHVIVDYDEEDLDHHASRAAINLVTPTYPHAAVHHGGSQRTIVSASDESDMISNYHGWESDDDDDDDHQEDDGIFELDLE